MRPVTDITRRVAPFHVVSEFQPSGDQPQAIAELEKRVNSGEPVSYTHLTLPTIYSV